MRKIKLGAYILMVLLLCLAGLGQLRPACAAEGKSHGAALFEELKSTRGAITERDSGSVTLSGEGYYPDVRLMLSGATLIVEGRNGGTITGADLKRGGQAVAYYGPGATRSLPPASQARLIILCPEGVEPPLFVQVARVELTKKEKSVRVVNGAGDMVLTITADVLKDYKKLRAGDRLLIWCKALTLSLPAYGYAEKAVLLEKGQ